MNSLNMSISVPKSLLWTRKEIDANPNINILDIDYSKAKGVCWARNKIQQHYNNEDFTLHLDSHHRFIEGWDTILKTNWSPSGSEAINLMAILPSSFRLKLDG